MPPVIDLESIMLAKGAHASCEKAVCVMELTSCLADEPFSDHPQCVSPVIGAFCRSWNDSLDDETRQRLKPYAQLVIGTRTTKQDERIRAWLATDWLVRTFAPAWLDRAGLDAHAASLRNLPELSSAALANKALPVIKAARAAARAAAGEADWAAAWATAWDAARAAAWATAGATAGAAAGAAAWAAAWDAAGATAGATAWATAGAAAWAAAGATAWDALQSTVAELQDSAFGLLDRMIVVGR
jgi:hypothetical protein